MEHIVSSELNVLGFVAADVFIRVASRVVKGIAGVTCCSVFSDGSFVLGFEVYS